MGAHRVSKQMNSSEFDQFEAVGARFDPGTGDDVATVSSQWLYGLPKPRPHLWYYFFRHRYQLAPIGAAAPFSDLMVSRKGKMAWRFDALVSNQHGIRRVWCVEGTARRTAQRGGRHGVEDGRCVDLDGVDDTTP